MASGSSALNSRMSVGCCWFWYVIMRFLIRCKIILQKKNGNNIFEKFFKDEDFVCLCNPGSGGGALCGGCGPHPLPLSCEERGDFASPFWAAVAEENIRRDGNAFVDLQVIAYGSHLTSRGCCHCEPRDAAWQSHLVGAGLLRRGAPRNDTGCAAKARRQSCCRVLPHPAVFYC